MSQSPTQAASKIVAHPTPLPTPLMTISEALGIAQADGMKDVCIVYTDAGDQIRVLWSKQSGADLAAAALVLTATATKKLTDG